MLVLIRSQYLAGSWVDEVHACAGRAGHGLVRFGFRLTWILRDPALHIQAGIGAAKDKSNRHNIPIKASRLVTTLIQRNQEFDWP